MKAKSPTVFISYVHEDRRTVDYVRKVLRDFEYDVFTYGDVAPSEPWRDKINKAIEDAVVVLAIWSPNSVKSGAVMEECRLAAQRQKLVPLVVGDFSWSNAPRHLWSIANRVTAFEEESVSFRHWLGAELGNYCTPKRRSRGFTYSRSHSFVHHIAKTPVELARCDEVINGGHSARVYPLSYRFYGGDAAIEEYDEKVVRLPLYLTPHHGASFSEAEIVDNPNVIRLFADASHLTQSKVLDADVVHSDDKVVRANINRGLAHDDAQSESELASEERASLTVVGDAAKSAAVRTTLKTLKNWITETPDRKCVSSLDWFFHSRPIYQPLVVRSYAGGEADKEQYRIGGLEREVALAYVQLAARTKAFHRATSDFEHRYSVLRSLLEFASAPDAPTVVSKPISRTTRSSIGEGRGCAAQWLRFHEQHAFDLPDAYAWILSSLGAGRSELQGELVRSLGAGDYCPQASGHGLSVMYFAQYLVRQLARSGRLATRSGAGCVSEGTQAKEVLSDEPCPRASQLPETLQYSHNILKRLAGLRADTSANSGCDRRALLVPTADHRETSIGDSQAARDEAARSLAIAEQSFVAPAMWTPRTSTSCVGN